MYGSSGSGSGSEVNSGRSVVKDSNNQGELSSRYWICKQIMKPSGCRVVAASGKSVQPDGRCALRTSKKGCV